MEALCGLVQADTGRNFTYSNSAWLSIFGFRKIRIRSARRCCSLAERAALSSSASTL